MATKVSPEQVQADLTNSLLVLRALDRVMPGKVDQALVAALEAILSNECLLTLLTHALQKLDGRA